MSEAETERMLDWQSQQTEMTPNEIAKQMLTEYGRAIRGNWAFIDGRTVWGCLEAISNAIDNPNANVAQLRDELDLCEQGNCWSDECECKPEEGGEG